MIAKKSNIYLIIPRVLLMLCCQLADSSTTVGAPCGAEAEVVRLRSLLCEHTPPPKLLLSADE